MESDLEHLAEGEKLRLGQAGALVPRTEQDHISSDAGAPSPVCHKCKATLASAEVQPRWHALCTR